MRIQSLTFGNKYKPINKKAKPAEPVVTKTQIASGVLGAVAVTFGLLHKPRMF